MASIDALDGSFGPSEKVSGSYPALSWLRDVGHTPNRARSRKPRTLSRAQTLPKYVALRLKTVGRSTASSCFRLFSRHGVPHHIEELSFEAKPGDLSQLRVRLVKIVRLFNGEPKASVVSVNAVAYGSPLTDAAFGRNQNRRAADESPPVFEECTTGGLTPAARQKMRARKQESDN